MVGVRIFWLLVAVMFIFTAFRNVEFDFWLFVICLIVASPVAFGAAKLQKWLDRKGMQ